MSFSIWSLLFSVFFGLGISLGLIISSVQRVAPGRRITYYALYLATLIPLIMVVGLVALLFGIFPSLIADLSAGGDATLYVIREDLMILIMVIALSFSLISLKKGFQAKRSSQVAA